MTPERHREICDLFQQIAELPAQRRASELDRLCRGDDELRREVESLFEHHHEGHDNFHENNVGVGRFLVAEQNAGTPDVARSSALPAQIGRFRIIRRIGEGGMGVVFEAEQDNPRRTVALKVIRAGLASDSVVRRFRHEAEVLGRLQHLGIADVYEAGVAETPLGQQPYFAMQLIQGAPLIDYAMKHQLDTRARLELFTRVCDAVGYAHQRGIIHRDLKPANILVDESGQPKVLDFGVARVTNDGLTLATMQTVTGQVIGTLPYMSPEQISGTSADVDTRSDVYSLGVSLYELLTGRLPYRVLNCTLAEAARIIADVEPTRLSLVDRRFRGDVETIVSKALQKDCGQRYQSVADFAADIRRYLADEPVQARPPSAMYQLRKFARRNKGLVGGAMGVFVALIMGLAGVLWFAAQESRQRASAERATGDARRLAYRVSVNAAAVAIDENNLPTARRLLDEAPQELRGWEWRHLLTQLDNSFVQIRGMMPAGGWIHVRADGDVVQRTVRSVTYASAISGKILEQIDSAEGFTIAVNRGATMVAAVTEPTRVKIRYLKERLEKSLPNFPEPVQSLCFSDDSTMLAVCGATGALHILDLIENKDVRTKRLPRPAFEMQFSPDGRRLVANDIDGLFIVDVAAGRLLHALDSPGYRRLPNLAWTLDSELILRREVRLGDIRHCIVPIHASTGQRLARWPDHHREVSFVDLAPDGRSALVAFLDGLIRICSLPDGATQLELRSEGGPAFSPVFSPDGTRLAFGELSGLIRVVDRATARTIAILRGQHTATSGLAFSSSGNTLFSTAQDGVIRGWDLTKASENDVLRGHSSYVYPVAYSPDGMTLASASWDRTVRLWEPGSGKERAVLRGHAGVIRSLVFSPDSRHLISTTLNGEEEILWDLASGAHVLLPQRGAARLEPPAFLEDGQRVWLPGELGEKELVWSIETKETGTIPVRGLRNLVDPRISPDGRWIARTLAPRSELTLVSIDDPAVYRKFTDEVACAAFNFDGSRLVTVGLESTSVSESKVTVWDVATGRPLFDLHGHIGDVFDARFSPDGKRLATCGRDGTVRIWGSDQFDQLVRLRGHQDYIWSVAWSPDGRTLASGSGDTTVRLWRSDK